LATKTETRGQAQSHYDPDKLSEGLPQAAYLSAIGNVTAAHDLSPISAALLAYNFIIADSKGNGIP